MLQVKRDAGRGRDESSILNLAQCGGSGELKRREYIVIHEFELAVSYVSLFYVSLYARRKFRKGFHRDIDMYDGPRQIVMLFVYSSHHTTMGSNWGELNQIEQGDIICREGPSCGPSHPFVNMSFYAVS